MDIVYILKRKTLLDSKDATLMSELERDVSFLMKKIKQEGSHSTSFTPKKAEAKKSSREIV